MFYKKLHFVCGLYSAIKIRLPHLQISKSQRFQVPSFILSSLIEVTHAHPNDFIEGVGRVAFGITMPIVTIEFHHNLLIPNLIVSVDSVGSNHLFSPKFPACCISTFVWWAWYFIHCMALTDCLSFGRYPCGGMIPIDSLSKKRLRNTRLQTEAMVMQRSKGSTPSRSSRDVISMKIRGIWDTLAWEYRRQTDNIWFFLSENQNNRFDVLRTFWGTGSDYRASYHLHFNTVCLVGDSW